MSFVIWAGFPKEKPVVAKWKKYLIFVVIGISLFVAGFTFKTPFFLKNTHNKFDNQDIRNTELVKYIKTSPDSTYMVFCFSYTCPHCWNSVENLRQYKLTNTANIMALGVGNEKDKGVFNDYFKPDFKITNISISEMNKLTDTYPTAFYISHDTIKRIMKSEVPSPFIFKKLNNNL